MNSTRMVQVRDVSAETVDILKARAATERLSLSDYLKRELEALASRPSMADVLRRLSESPRRSLVVTGADLVREGRDEYDQT